MSTFTFGFVITQLVQLNNSNQNELMKPNLKIWAREDLHDELNVSTQYLWFLSKVSYPSLITQLITFP